MRRTDLTVVSLKEIASGLPTADDDGGAAAAAQAEQAQAARAARLAQGTQQVGLCGWDFVGFSLDARNYLRSFYVSTHSISGAHLQHPSPMEPEPELEPQPEMQLQPQQV
eukprot:COSAG01_NODE_16540_length_1227_cov_53.709220_2_plen_110_part_00